MDIISSMTMTKTQLKSQLLTVNSHCKCCGVKMVVSSISPKFGQYSNEAMLTEHGTLICFCCHLKRVKAVERNRFPLLKRCRLNIDAATGIFTWLNAQRKRYNKFVWVHIKGNELTGRN